MKMQRFYSALFSCIHDEHGPVGHLGRGTHHSVFRVVQAYNVQLLPLPELHLQDFAVVWDEDHDKRIIRTLEQMYVENALSPVLFAGERKGTLTLLVSPELISEPIFLAEFKSRVSKVLNNPAHGDYWSLDIGVFDRRFRGTKMDVQHLIHAEKLRVRTYVRNIDSLWTLGLKELKVDTRVTDWAYPGMPEAETA